VTFLTDGQPTVLPRGKLLFDTERRLVGRRGLQRDPLCLCVLHGQHPVCLDRLPGDGQAAAVRRRRAGDRR